LPAKSISCWSNRFSGAQAFCVFVLLLALTCALSQNCEKTELPHLLQHFYNYYRDGLAELGLLSADKSKPQWLGPLASHLAFHDPHNLLLLYMLDRSALEVYSNVDASAPNTMEPLLLRLSAVLCPEEVHPALAKKCHGRQSTITQSGVVAEVPADVRARVREYNQLMLRLFMEFTASLDSPQLARLPLTHKAVGGTLSALAQQLGLNTPKVSPPVSLFARTSGVAPASHFTSLDRVVQLVRSDLCVEHCSLPLVRELTHFNSFVLDFFRRLQVTNADTIRNDNFLHRAWYLLHNFQRALRVIATATNKMHSHQDNVMDANLYRMLAEDTDPIYPNDIAATDAASVVAEKRLGNAFVSLVLSWRPPQYDNSPLAQQALLSAEFSLKFKKLVN
jgi:hypothetical protein